MELNEYELTLIELMKCAAVIEILRTHNSFYAVSYEIKGVNAMQKFTFQGLMASHHGINIGLHLRQLHYSRRN